MAARLAVATAFLALEEVSWGQHIFGFATPAGISALNAQHETNFHNIRGIYFELHRLGILMLFAFFVVVPLLATHAWLARVFETLKMPLVPLQIAALFAFAYAGFEAFRVLHSIFPQQGVNYGELQETAYELILLVFAVTLLHPPASIRTRDGRRHGISGDSCHADANPARQHLGLAGGGVGQFWRGRCYSLGLRR